MASRYLPATHDIYQRLISTAVLLSIAFVCRTPSAAAAALEPSIPLARTSSVNRPVFTLSAAVNTSIKNFPSVLAARYKVQAAAADVTLAKTAYLPRFDLLAQELVTSTNVVQGSVLPQMHDTLPVQSGKEQTANSMKGFLGMNAGSNFNWLIYDFGLRGANVGLARAQQRFASANVRLTELDVAFNTADLYLRTVANIETIRAQRATVDRMQAADITAHTLVDSGLRAGVDAALADFELSQAKIRLFEAERNAELLRVDLAESMGLAGNFIEVIAEPVVSSPNRAVFVAKIIPQTHPLLQLRGAAVQTEAAKVHVQDRAWYPKVYMSSVVWGRGSGARGIQTPLAAGILPNVANYAFGFTVNFPALDIFEIRARKRKAVADERAERANLDLALQILEQKDAKAKVLLYESRRIADETPVMVNAARENQVKTLERYSVGLSDMVAVAQAERMLAQAEVENAVAQVQVWRAILAAAYVQGDLKPFLNLVALAERRAGSGTTQ